MKRIRIILFALLVLVLASCGGVNGDNQRALTHEQAVEQVNSYFTTGKVQYATVAHGEDTSWVGVDTSAEDMPPIDKYPPSVTGGGQINVEIFSSTEKSNANQHRWLDDMAEKFNNSGVTVNGKTVSVTIRPIASGLALDYIKSRKYIPTAYSPANELWGSMIASSGIPVKPVEKRLVGNVAGILMKQATYDSFRKDFGDVTIPNVIKATQAKKLTLGHTDPNQSSTGLNILMQELLAFDPHNPVSQTAADGFRQYQATVPPTSPTTAEMSKVAAKGILDAMIMEAQAYMSEPTLATGWVFTPVGVRHDSPLYALGNASQDQIAALGKFAELCLSPDSQRVASDTFRFNQYNDYAGVPNKLSGQQLFSALDLWKSNKDAGQPVVSVFVVDRSGSMDGSKLTRVKAALRSAAGHINPGNYVGLVSYSDEDNITLDLPIGQFGDRQRSQFAGAINDLRSGGGTATNNALFVGLKLMMEAQANVPNAKLRILVMSDGQQNKGLGLDDTLGVISGLGIPVYGVGFEADLRDLTKLSEPNEGFVINADSDDVTNKLTGLFRQTL